MIGRRTSSTVPGTRVGPGVSATQAELVAEKKDFFVAVVKTAEPTDKARRQKIEKQFTKFHAEHLIVYIDGNGGQVWQLAVRRPQQPIGYHEVPWHKGQKPELLYEKLTGLFVALDEEDSITVIDVTDRARRQFEADPGGIAHRDGERLHCITDG